jgi:hypothetical protein
MKRFLVCAAAVWLPLVYAAELPKLKEGLWTVRSQSTNNPGNRKTDGTYSLCRDRAYDLQSQAAAKSMKGCKVVKETLLGTKYTTETRCTIEGSTIEIRGATTFVSDKAMHSEGHTTFTPPLRGMVETTSIIDQTYISACPAGLEPGDTIDAAGKITRPAKR